MIKLHKKIGYLTLNSHGVKMNKTGKCMWDLDPSHAMNWSEKILNLKLK